MLEVNQVALWDGALGGRVHVVGPRRSLATMLATSACAALLAPASFGVLLLSQAPRAGRTEMSASGRKLTWSAKATASEPCDAPIGRYLSEAAGDDLVIRLDESVESWTSPSAGRINARMHPLRLPGLTVVPTAEISVDAVPAGLRYRTERVRCEYKGAFSELLSKVQPQVTALSDLRSSNNMLVMNTEFLLTVPLPSWWPIPDSVSDVGSSMIRGIVEKDTRQSVTRIKAEYAAWRKTASGSRPAQ